MIKDRWTYLGYADHLLEDWIRVLKEFGVYPDFATYPLCYISYESFSISNNVVFAESLILHFRLLHVPESVDSLHKANEYNLIVDLRENFNQNFNLLEEEISTSPEKLPLNFYNSGYCSFEVPLN